jgi:hypothetical protein
MSSTPIFIILSAVFALAGLFAAAMAHDYLQLFGVLLFLWGTLFGYSCIKRHYDAAETAKH